MNHHHKIKIITRYLLFNKEMAATVTTPATKRIAVVTGGNKGIGLEICRQLASNGILVVLTARDEKRGMEAVENLKVEGHSDVVFHQLDLMDPFSITPLAQYIETHFGKLDILVNNAGISGVILNLKADEVVGAKAHLVKETANQTYQRAEECLKTNYYGAKQLTQALIPLLQLSNAARIVNVSSTLGQLMKIPNERTREELGGVHGLTEERVDEVVKRFLQDVKEDVLEAKGWPTNLSAYIVSKAALNAYTRILAEKLPNFCINSVSPGFVKTDMNHNTGIFTVQEGARGPVMLALLPHGGPSGLFFDQMEISTF